MANMQMTKTPMPEQDPQVRNANFLEVAQGYTCLLYTSDAADEL